MTQPLRVTRHQAEQGMACFPFHCTVAPARPHLHSRNRSALGPGSRIKSNAATWPRTHASLPSEQRYTVIPRSIHNPGYYFHWRSRGGPGINTGFGWQEIRSWQSTSTFQLNPCQDLSSSVSAFRGENKMWPPSHLLTGHSPSGYSPLSPCHMENCTQKLLQLRILSLFRVLRK